MKTGQRRAHVDVAFPSVPAPTIGEETTLVGRIAGVLPASLTMKLARKTIRGYSDQIGHDLNCRLVWR